MLTNFLSRIRGDQCIISREQGSNDPLGDSDVVVGEGDLIFSQVIPLVITKLYILFVGFDSLRPSERFFNCVFMDLPGLTNTKNRINVSVKIIVLASQ